MLQVSHPLHRSTVQGIASGRSYHRLPLWFLVYNFPLHRPTGIPPEPGDPGKLSPPQVNRKETSSNIRGGQCLPPPHPHLAPPPPTPIPLITRTVPSWSVPSYGPIDPHHCNLQGNRLRSLKRQYRRNCNVNRKRPPGNTGKGQRPPPLPYGDPLSSSDTVPPDSFFMPIYGRIPRTSCEHSRPGVSPVMVSSTHTAETLERTDSVVS